MPKILPDEIEWTAVRAQGPGGQHVNKVSSAVHLRFNIRQSSLPDRVKTRLLELPGSRVNKDGVLIIKAQGSRSQDENRQEALARLQALVTAAAVNPTPRRPTRPTLGSQRRRLASKALRAQIKTHRSKVNES